MHKLVRTLISAALLLASQGVKGSYRQITHQGGVTDTCHTPCTELKEGKATIFIHGTVFPGISRLMGHKEKRRGLYHYSANPRRLTVNNGLEEPSILQHLKNFLSKIFTNITGQASCPFLHEKVPLKNFLIYLRT